MKRAWRRITLLALFGVLAGVTAADGSAVVDPLNIVLSASGPSPTVATLQAAQRVPYWVNQDQVTHTVVFANGLCSFQVPPGEQAYCSDTFWEHVGRYPYTVDGTIAASVVVVAVPRLVTLSAKSHVIRRGSRLTLYGSETFSNVSPPRHSGFPVVVLARHDRRQPFRRIAVVAPPKEAAGGFLWKLHVRPRTRTVYIAELNDQPDVWQRAWSRPFTVSPRR